MASKDRSLKQQIIDELDFVEFFCSKIFLCPYTCRTKLDTLGYKFTFHLLLFIAIQLLLTLIFNNKNDWLEIINIAPNFGVTLMAAIKFSKVYENKELYNAITNHFRDDIWRFISLQSKQQADVIERYKFVIKHFNRFLVYYSCLLILIVTSFPYLVMVYQKKNIGDNPEYFYPFDGWYPFDKVKWYWVVYIWEAAMTAVIVCVYAFLSVLHATYIGYICMELKIIGIQIEGLISEEDVKYFTNGNITEATNRNIVRKLKTLISRHTFLAKTSQKLDAVLGDAMLLSYTLGAVFICLTAFTCIVVNNFYKSVRYSFMCASLLYDTFNQCLYGQVIRDHSEDLANAVYFCDWPSCSSEIKKMILIILMRTQKPFQITAKGLLSMNMFTFSRICSTSYQLFNILLTMYAK